MSATPSYQLVLSLGEARFAVISRMPDDTRKTVTGDGVAQLLADLAGSPDKETLHRWFEGAR